MFFFLKKIKSTEALVGLYCKGSEVGTPNTHKIHFQAWCLGKGLVDKLLSLYNFS